MIDLCQTIGTDRVRMVAIGLIQYHTYSSVRVELTLGILLFFGGGLEVDDMVESIHRNVFQWEYICFVSSLNTVPSWFKNSCQFMSFWYKKMVVLTDFVAFNFDLEWQLLPVCSMWKASRHPHRIILSAITIKITFLLMSKWGKKYLRSYLKKFFYYATVWKGLVLLIKLLIVLEVVSFYLTSWVSLSLTLR